MGCRSTSAASEPVGAKGKGFALMPSGESRKACRSFRSTGKIGTLFCSGGSSKKGIDARPRKRCLFCLAFRSAKPKSLFAHRQREGRGYGTKIAVVTSRCDHREGWRAIFRAIPALCHGQSRTRTGNARACGDLASHCKVVQPHHVGLSVSRKRVCPIQLLLQGGSNGAT